VVGEHAAVTRKADGVLMSALRSSDVETAARRGAEDIGASLNDGLSERDRLGSFDRDLWNRCAAFGVLGLTMPERFGGSEQAAPVAVSILEGLGFGCRDNGLLFALGAQLWSVQMPILALGSDDQQTRYLPGLVDGSLIGAHAVTEPEAGSDAFSLRTTANRDGDDYVLDGAKTFVTNAPVADVFLVVATLEPGSGSRGLTAFLVDRDTPGLTVSEPFEKAGLRTSAMAEVSLSGCRVPRAQLLGRERGGAAVFGVAMEWERSFILAPALGTMRRQLAECVRYARSRRQFGEPIGKREPVASKLVEMQLRQETCQLLVDRVARLKQDGRRLTYEPSQVKLHVSESWVQASLDALQIHGGAGYMVELGVERDLRDALASKIYSGTSEIQRTIIAGFLGL
jgi:alkylation response protein AidB-like acyl-CoA dehydrogenase